MSRIGSLPITIPSEVTATIGSDQVTAKGPRGELSLSLPPAISVELNDNVLTVGVTNGDRKASAMRGLARALLANLIHGVHTGFTKELELVGVGYRVEVKGDKLVFNLGFSHPTEFALPEGVDARVEGQRNLLLTSTDKQLVGQVAADIRALRPPEPYKGKGIRYANEHVRRKAGKSAKK